MEPKFIHRAPLGWKVRGFKNWLCGKTAEKTDSGTTDNKEVECPQCKAELAKPENQKKSSLV